MHHHVSGLPHQSGHLEGDLTRCHQTPTNDRVINFCTKILGLFITNTVVGERSRLRSLSCYLLHTLLLFCPAKCSAQELSFQHQSVTVSATTCCESGESSRMQYLRIWQHLRFKPALCKQTVKQPSVRVCAFSFLCQRFKGGKATLFCFPLTQY